jgi:hypothetical protein
MNPLSHHYPDDYYQPPTQVSAGTTKVGTRPTTNVLHFSGGDRVRPFHLKNFFAYKRNKVKLDPFHMCFTISL